MTAVYTFHTTIHALPPEAVASKSVALRGASFATLQVPHSVLGTNGMTCTFEEANSALNRLPRMYCEPDGSFVWASPQEAPPWQVDGNLYDHANQLLFVDAKGYCPADDFDRLLSAFGWPGQRLMFQLVREAVFLGEAEFRRYAAQAPK